MLTSPRSAVTGLRTVAAFEAAKGLLVMATGLGLLSLLHHDVQRAAESVVRHLHLNPARDHELIHHATAPKAVLLLVNVGIVGYVCYIRLVRPPE